MNTPHEKLTPHHVLAAARRDSRDRRRRGQRAPAPLPPRLPRSPADRRPVPRAPCRDPPRRRAMAARLRPLSDRWSLRPRHPRRRRHRPDRSPRRPGRPGRPRLGRRDHLHRVRRRAVARPSRGHARDPAPGHPPTLAPLLAAVEADVADRPLPAARTRLPPAGRGSRHDRRTRRPLVGVPLRVRRYAARREPAADRDLLGSARVAGDRATASCRPALYANRSSHYRFKPGDAATTSWPRWRRLFTSFVPTNPVPPTTTIFILLFMCVCFSKDSLAQRFRFVGFA